MKVFILLSLLLGLQTFSLASDKDQVTQLREMKQELIVIELKTKIGDAILSLYDAVNKDAEEFHKLLLSQATGFSFKYSDRKFQENGVSNYAFEVYGSVSQAMSKNAFDINELIQQNEALKTEQKVKQESFYELKRKLGFELDEEFESN